LPSGRDALGWRTENRPGAGDHVARTAAPITAADPIAADHKRERRPSAMEVEANNPLFDAAFSPSPVHGAADNPVWSPAGGDAPPSGLERSFCRFGEGGGAAADAALLSPERAPPGGAAAAAAAGGRDRPEEAQFADAVARTMRGELAPADAVAEHAAACAVRGAALRELAAAALGRAPRAAALADAAAELEAEAATWRLLWHLHGAPGADFPAGRGGDFVEGAGFAKTGRQLAADAVFADASLNRAARAVVWLESLAADAHPAPEAGVAPGDGGWRLARARLASGAGGAAAAAAAAAAARGGLITELDPDAPTRQRRRLDADDARGEGALLTAVWRLVRAGRVARAAALCEAAGQPWRAAALAGGGAAGPLPLGAAAEEADAAPGSAAEQAEALAAEVAAGGAGAPRALWRWACWEAAERAAAEPGGNGGNGGNGPSVLEAAIFGALSCNLPHALPACASWEDSAWAHLRCWLEAEVDARLCGGEGAAEPGAGAVAGEAAAGGDAAGAAAVAAAAAAAAPGGWPPPATRAALPRSLAAAAEAAHATHGAAGAPPGAARHRRVQTDLILDRIDELVGGALIRWIMGGDGAASSCASTAAEGPACPPGLLRFAAHLALALWSLGVAELPAASGSSAAPHPAAAFDPLHDRLQRLVQLYAVHLIDSGRHALVPPYACHLRAGLRRATYLILLEQLVAGGDMGACRDAHAAGAAAFGAWRRGDVEEREMAAIALRALAKAQMEVRGGPALRAATLRWLVFDAGDAADAARWAAALCREFALGGAGGAAAAAGMLFEVVPAAAGAPDGLERLLVAAADSGAAAEAGELRMWAAFFELEAECAAWEEVHGGAVAAAAAVGARNAFFTADGGDGFAALADARRETLALLEAAVAFLRDGALDWLVGGGDGAAAGAAAGEVAVVLGPEEGAAAPAAVRAGAAYPAFESAEARGTAAEALQAALARGAAAAGLRGLAFHTGAAPDDGAVALPGLLSVAADCGGGGAAGAAALLALALKGALRAGDGGAGRVGPFVATNLSAAPGVAAALSRAVIAPRVALRAAVLRRAAAALGHAGEEGAEVAVLAVGDALAPLFSAPEAAALLQLEREGAALRLRNAERAAEAGGGAPSA
jgi:hypothetical protein